MAFERDQKCRRGLHHVSLFKYGSRVVTQPPLAASFSSVTRTNQPKALTGKVEAD
jgi:hypothetical protein